MNKPPPLTEEDRANLVAYLDSELEPSALSALEAKLNLSTQGRAEAEALRRTRSCRLVSRMIRSNVWRRSGQGQLPPAGGCGRGSSGLAGPRRSWSPELS